MRSQVSDSHNGVDCLSSRDGDLESDSSNLDTSVRRLLQSSKSNRDPEKTQGGKAEVKTTLKCSQTEAPIHIISSMIDNQNFDGQCLHTSCPRRPSRNQSLEMVLEATLLLSSVHAAGAYAFGQMIRNREPDPNSKRSLQAFIALFSASFLCTFLGALILLIIVSRRDYYQYKKLCLVISNTAAFVLMMIGYCFVGAFNM